MGSECIKKPLLRYSIVTSFRGFGQILAQLAYKNNVG